MQALTTIDTPAALAYVSGDGYDYDQAITAASDAWRALHRDALAFGLHLLAIREREPQGQYLAALERIGVHPRTAQRFVPRVEFLLQNNNATALSHLTGEQLDQLRKLPPMLRDKALDAAAGTIAGRPIAEVATLTTNEFRKALLSYVDEAPDTPKPARTPLDDALIAIQRLNEADRTELARRLSILPLLSKTPWKVVRRDRGDAK